MASTALSATERVAELLRSRSAEMAAESVRRFQLEIPGYGVIEDPSLIGDVEAHVREHHAALVAVLTSGAPVTAEQLAFIRPHASLRARRGVPLADFMHAFRLGHLVVWETVLELADEDAGGLRAAVDFAGQLITYIDHASTHAAEAYLEAQQLLVAEGDRVRRDLLEDLLAGRESSAGPRQAILRAAGLGPESICLLIVAVPVSAPTDDLPLRAAAARLARELGGSLSPLAVARQNEVVLVCALGDRQPGALAEPLRRVWEQLADEGTRLAVGVSTPQRSPYGLGAAYRDAIAAIERLPADGGVLFLPDMRLVDFLTSRTDETALRLVRPELRAFVEEDTAGGGTLTRTLLAYVNADMNARLAAERLFIHVNTAYQRLERISERTGLDLRRFADVEELLAAVKLLRGL